MKVPLSWLRRYCDPGWETARIGERLAMTGTELERVVAIGAASTDNYVIGRVDAVADIPTPTSCGSAKSTPARRCGRSSVARPTSPPARPLLLRCRAPCCRTATS